jgi:hypothetical protein
MKHTFAVRVSQRDADIALQRFIFRGAGWGTLVAATLCLAFVVYDISDGSIGHLGVVILTLLSILAIVYVVAFVTRRKQMVDLLRRLGDSSVSYRLDGSELATESALGSSTLKWEMIQKLWVDPDVTLVFYARNGYTTIPTTQIPADALSYLISQVERVGGAILNKNTKAQQGVAPNA